MIGKTINNYIIERKLGDGGMGEVYYARHNKVDREVAIKVLYSHLFTNENIHNRFKNEANALIKLNHPHIVKIYDYVEQENFACLIMEYINGYSLDTYISQVSGPLPSQKATSIICSVLDAVQYAHDNNVYHRDIKPANIMISKDGSKVRIMDFGIAKLTDSKNFKTTHANTQLGTPFYMSPEQIKGLPFTRMGDIYSLGVTLFEMVTGKCPYHHITSLFELQSKIVNEPLPLTNEYYPGVSLRIQNAINIATQKSPENRFQNCDFFKNYLLENDVLSIPVATNVNTPAKKISLPQKSGINWSVYVVSALALIIVVILLFKMITKEPEPVTLKSESIIQTPTTAVTKDTVTVKPIQPIQKVLSVQEKNQLLLNEYIANKQNETKILLTNRKKDKITGEIAALNYLITFDQLKSKYDELFIQKPIVSMPSDDQIMIDFWNTLSQKKDICRLLYDNKKQISGIYIVNKFKNSENPPKEISVVVNFVISPEDDETDKTACSITLKYGRTGNIYKLIGK
jgi:serine/threonine protein kinase